jgi:hypothetical protein
VENNLKRYGNVRKSLYRKPGRADKKALFRYLLAPPGWDGVVALVSRSTVSPLLKRKHIWLSPSDLKILTTFAGFDENNIYGPVYTLNFCVQSASNIPWRHKEPVQPPVQEKQ